MTTATAIDAKVLFHEYTVTAVEPSGDGWIVEFAEGGIHVPSWRESTPPRPGETIRCYGEGITKDVHGVVVGGRVYFYRSPREPQWSEWRALPVCDDVVQMIAQRSEALRAKNRCAVELAVANEHLGWLRRAVVAVVKGESWPMRDGTPDDVVRAMKELAAVVSSRAALVGAVREERKADRRHQHAITAYLNDSTTEADFDDAIAGLSPCGGQRCRVRERPILFSAPMVRAILAGHKSVTRRLVKPQPPTEAEAENAGCQYFSLSPRVARSVKVYFSGQYESLPKETGVFEVHGSVGYVRDRCGKTEWTCPYGIPGDRLWVRETWRADSSHDPEDTIYRADLRDDWVAEMGSSVTWRPSIFMPRVRSRITLEVSGVRVERLHAITDDEAVREGVQWWSKDGTLRKYAPADDEGDGPMWPWRDCPRSPREAFERLWCEINGRASWDANPYVWVVEFERGKA